MTTKPAATPAETPTTDAQPGAWDGMGLGIDPLSTEGIVFQGEAPALAPAEPAPEVQPVTAATDALDNQVDKTQMRTPLFFAHRVTRLKMTLNYLDPVPGDIDNPLTRCTFGAVYSKEKTEEDYVFGKYTPYGNLSYNVRSDLAEHLEVGAAYYIDIQKVPS